MKHKLIGLCGPKGCGKSAIANSLSNWQVVSFAEPMRQMMDVLVDLDELSEKGKEAPLDSLCGRSYRYALQTLGTEWGRDMMRLDIWTTRTMREVKKYRRSYDVIIDDVRFNNEAQAIIQAGGKVIYVQRASIYKGGDGHPSEGGVFQDLIHKDIDNTGSIEETLKQLEL